MNVGWLIDAGINDTAVDDLAAAVRRCGHAAELVMRPLPPYGWEDVDCSYREAFPAGSCVVTYGDIDLVKRVQADAIWSPGVFADTKQYHCSAYFEHFAEYVLNLGSTTNDVRGLR